MPVVSSLLNYFPHLQALSASSPMWSGTDTGYASNRAMMFQQLPTAGLPFQFATWEEYEEFVDGPPAHRGHRVRSTTSAGTCGPRRGSGTVEVRICDGVSNLRELAALTALTHCLVVDLTDRLSAGETLPTMPPWHVQENKWRAARYGMVGSVSPAESRSVRSTTRQCVSAVRAASSRRLETPSQIRTSTVPSLGRAARPSGCR